MYQGTLVFAQVMAYLPLSAFRRCVAAHDGEHKVKDFSCLRGAVECRRCIVNSSSMQFYIIYIMRHNKQA